MEEVSVPCQFSASKLRRARATATKRRLFEAAYCDSALVKMHSQLAMLTSTIDCLIYQLAANHVLPEPVRSNSNLFKFDPHAPVFAPPQSELCKPEGLLNKDVHVAEAKLRLDVSSAMPFENRCKRTRSPDDADPGLFLDATQLGQVSQTSGIKVDTCKQSNGSQDGCTDIPGRLPKDVLQALQHCLHSFVPMFPNIYQAAIADEQEHTDHRRVLQLSATGRQHFTTSLVTEIDRAVVGQFESQAHVFGQTEAAFKADSGLLRRQIQQFVENMVQYEEDKLLHKD